MGEMILVSGGEITERILSQYEDVIQEMESFIGSFGRRVKYSDLERTRWTELDKERAGLSKALLGRSLGMSPEQRAKYRSLMRRYNEDVCGRIVR